VVGRRLLIAVIAAVCAGGCASSGAQTLATRFVTQGTPAVDLGGPRLVSSRAAKTRNPLAGTSITQVSSRTSGSMSAVEAFNPQLRDALFRLLLAPSADHHLQVARAYLKIGIFDNAYDYLARSLVLNGPDPAVHDALARLWREWGNPGVGLSHAYQAVSLAPNWAVAQNTLGTLLYVLGDRDAARLRFEQAVQLDPEAAYGLDNLCTLNTADGRAMDAIAFCQRAKTARESRTVNNREEFR